MNYKMSYSLVSFRNGQIHIYPSIKVDTQSGFCTLRDKNCRYEVDCLYSHDNQDILKRIKQQITEKKLIVLLTKEKITKLGEEILQEELDYSCISEVLHVDKPKNYNDLGTEMCIKETPMTEITYSCTNNVLQVDEVKYDTDMGQEMCFEEISPTDFNYGPQILAEALQHSVIILDNTLIRPARQEIDSGTRQPKKKAPQKKHCCFYCQKHLVKMYRHYTQVHKSEKEVKEIIALPLKSSYRKVLLDKLRKQGDYLFNTEIKDENQQLIVCRETYVKSSRKKNVPCPNCKGYYSKFSIRHHVQKCLPTDKKTGRTNIQVECRRLENNIHPKASEVLRTRVFPVLNEDEVTNVIRYDEAVINYANYLCRKYTAEHHHSQIRANIRALGRLILAIKELNQQIHNLSEVLDPIFIDLITEGIDKVAGLNPDSHLYKSPATAMLLATELKKLCKLMEMECIKTGDTETQKKMENLNLLFNLEFHVTVNKKGLETQKVNHRRKKVSLPKTEQIAEFRIFLEEKMKHYIKVLEEKYSQKSWKHLAEYTLVHLAVFNRKRPGETQRILIEDYNSYEIVEDEDLSNEFDTLSKEQIKKWARIRFKGKLGKNTALLVHRELGFKAINLILKYRAMAGVHPKNAFVFGEPSQYKANATFQACSLIRKLSTESNIENPQLLRTRLLRQHLATETAQSSVDPRLEGRVSDFMSHKRQIHEDYYVMTQKKDDITKVSKLLEDFSSFSKTSKTISPSTSKTETMMNISPTTNFSDSSDEDGGYDSRDNITQSELNYILGKKQTRHPWTTVEKETARNYFNDEIYSGIMLSRQKVNNFFHQHKDIYVHRNTHLIMQWVKLERKRVLDNKKGLKGKRQRWSTPEKEVLRTSAERHSSEGTAPSLPECELMIQENEVLSNRTPSMVKSFLYSNIKKLTRNSV